jgi:hypothetical protein
LLGSASTTNSAGNSTFGLFAESEINGSLTFTGTNDIGSQINLTLPNVSFLPSGSISFISEEWGSMELTGDVLFDEGAGDFGTVEIVEPEGVTA